MEKATCSVDACEKPVWSRGMCRADYAMWRKANMPPCTFDGCDKNQYSRGLCGGHYSRWRKHGDPSVVLPHPMVGQRERRGCSVEGCPEPHGALGKCYRHYSADQYAADPERHKAARAANWKRPGVRDREIARMKAKRAADLEGWRQYAAASYVKHRPKRQAYAKVYRKANPDKHREWTERRRARKANAPVNDLTAAQWREIKALYKYRCAYCHKKKPLTQDHVLALNNGGSHTFSNVIPACRTCNSRKGTRPAPAHQPLLM